MAITIVGRGTADDAYAGTTITPTIPGGVSVGDLMVFEMAHAAGPAVDALPSGWTTVGDSNVAIGGTEGGVSVCYRIYEAGDGNPTWGTAYLGGGWTYGSIIVYTGAADWYVGTPVADESPVGGSHTVDGITTQEDDAWVVATMACRGASTSASAYDSANGLSDIVDEGVGYTGEGVDGSLMHGRGLQVSAGASGSLSFNTSVSAQEVAVLAYEISDADPSIIEYPAPLGLAVTMVTPGITGISDIVDHAYPPLQLEVTMPAPEVIITIPRQLPLVGKHVKTPGRVADPDGGLTTPILSHDGVKPVWLEESVYTDADAIAAMLTPGATDDIGATGTPWRDGHFSGTVAAGTLAATAATGGLSVVRRNDASTSLNDILGQFILGATDTGSAWRYTAAFVGIAAENWGNNTDLGSGIGVYTTPIGGNAAVGRWLWTSEGVYGPASDATYDFGASGLRVKDGYFSGTVQLDTVEVTSGGPTLSSGSGTPEGAVTADIGSVFMRTDGGASTSVYVKESGTGNTGWTALGAAGGAVATDAIWDAKGDLAVGTGADTASRLAVGTNDHVLTADSGEATGVKWAAAAAGGLSTGTSFPGTPSTGDRYRRSDIDYLVFFYDGTQWVSEQLFTLVEHGGAPLPSGITSDKNVHVPVPLYGQSSIYVERLEGVVYTTAVNNAGNHWDILFRYGVSANWDTTIGSLTTESESSSTYVLVSSTVDAVATPNATYPSWRVTYDEIGTGGLLLAVVTMFYRVIAT